MEPGGCKYATNNSFRYSILFMVGSVPSNVDIIRDHPVNVFHFLMWHDVYSWEWDCSIT